MAMKCLAQGHNTVPGERIKPATLRSRDYTLPTELLVIHHLLWPYSLFVSDLETANQIFLQCGSFEAQTCPWEG